MAGVGPLRPARAALTFASNLAGVGALASTVPAAVRANFRRELIASSLVGIFIGVINTYYLVVARRLGASELLIALMLSGAFIGSILTIFAPYLFRTPQPARRLAVMWGVSRAAWVAALVITSPGWYAAMVIFFAIMATIPLPAYSRLMQAAYPARMRGRLLGAARSVMALLSVGTAPLAGALMDAWGYGPVLALAGVAGVLSTVAFAGVTAINSSSQPVQNPVHLIRVAFRRPAFRGFALAFNTFGMGGIILAPAIPIVLVDRFNASFTVVGVLTLLQGLMWAVGYVVWGRVADRWSGFRTSWASTFAQAAVPAAIIVALAVNNVWLLLLAYAALGLDMAGNDVGWQMSLMSMAPAEETTALAATFHFIIGVRGLGGPFIGGALVVAGGPALACVVSLGLALAGNLLMLRAARRFVPHRAEGEAG